MPAKRKAQSKHTKKKSVVKHRSSGFVSSYVRQRDEFYENHPRIRLLLGLLIISFAMAIGVLYYNKTIVFIGLTLDSQYGIHYPYVDTGYVQRK